MSRGGRADQVRRPLGLKSVTHRRNGSMAITMTAGAGGAHPSPVRWVSCHASTHLEGVQCYFTRRLGSHRGYCPA